jgi:hypothetical protein
MPQRTVFLEEDYPVFLVMKGRETDEAIALINVEKQNDDRFLSREIQNMFEKVYKIEQISEAQFETYELFGVPTTLPSDMTFIMIQTHQEYETSPSEIQRRKDELGIK